MPSVSAGELRYRAKEALKRFFEPGVSRHQDKLTGQCGEKIRGIGTMRTYVKDVSRFVTYCHQQYSIRDLGQITPEMADSYLAILHDRECSGGYIGRVKAALGWLSKALDGKERARTAPPLVTPGGGFHSDKRPERAYTLETGARIQAELSKVQDKQLGQVVALQRAAGLRVKEAANIRAQDIDPTACIIRVRKGTKGGRDRDVKVDPQHRQLLVDLSPRGAPARWPCLPWTGFTPRPHPGCCL